MRFPVLLPLFVSASCPKNNRPLTGTGLARPGAMILLVLDALVVREAGEEDGALVAAGLGAPLTAEQPHQVIVHRAVVAAEPRGPGRQVDLDAVIAGGITAFRKGFSPQ